MAFQGTDNDDDDDLGLRTHQLLRSCGAPEEQTIIKDKYEAEVVQIVCPTLYSEVQASVSNQCTDICSF